MFQMIIAFSVFMFNSEVTIAVQTYFLLEKASPRTNCFVSLITKVCGFNLRSRCKLLQRSFVQKGDILKAIYTKHIFLACFFDNVVFDILLLR